MVLKLLWLAIAHYKLPSLLDPMLVEQEICNVQRAKKARRRSLRCDRDVVWKSDETPCDKECRAQNDDTELTTLLLRWCKAVCSCFGFSIENFTSSFADGKALCLLVHYYHPGMLKRTETLPTTRDIPQSLFASKNDSCGNFNQFVKNDTSTNISNRQYERAIQNERLNSELANARMSELGGIPGMLPLTDSRNVPEEKSMILCVAYLCARLMESSKQILATITIQTYYRRYQRHVLFEKKINAASLILAHWRKNRETYFSSQKINYGASVHVIERFFLSNKEAIEIIQARRQFEEKKNVAATVLQVSVS